MLASYLKGMLRICALFVLLISPLSGYANPAGVISVVDADTWDVGDTRVRLFGIDAPELNQECTRSDGSAWNCGRWASEQTRLRYDGQTATCRSITLDRYGRTVARCLVNGHDAGRVMVQDGLALAYRKYSMDYDLEEKRAHVTARGIHEGSIERPAEFRSRRVAQAPRAPQAAPGDCVIKGNISSKGTRIYHAPGQMHYDRTRISTTKGERWFCSEADAIAAGWRRARR